MVHVLSFYLQMHLVDFTHVKDGRFVAIILMIIHVLVVIYFLACVMEVSSFATNSVLDGQEWSKHNQL